jgi:hypothetical protein
LAIFNMKQMPLSLEDEYTSHEFTYWVWSHCLISICRVLYVPSYLIISLISISVYGFHIILRVNRYYLKQR